MNKSLFIIRLSIRGVWRFKLISAARMVSCYFCFVIISFFLATYFGSSYHGYRAENGGASKASNSLSMYVANSMEQAPSNHDYITYEKWGFQDRVVFDGAYITDVRFTVVDENYFDVFGLADGSDDTPTPRPESECVIGWRVAHKYGIDVHDKLTIGYTEFTVSGISSAPRFSLSIIIARDDVVTVGFPQYFYYDKLEGGAGRAGLLLHGDEIEEYLNTPQASGLMAIAYILTPCILILSYTLITLINLFEFYKKKTSLSQHISHFVGASPSAIVFQRIFENMIIYAISGACSYLTVSYALPLIMRHISIRVALPPEALLFIGSIVVLLSVAFGLSSVKNAVGSAALGAPPLIG